MKRVAIGIDIGGTNTVLGVVDENGDVLVKDSISTPTHGDVAKYVASLSESINELIDSVHKLNADAEVMGIGIGAPNGNYYKGTIEQAANLAFRGVVPLVDLLKEKFPHLKALALTNDANAAAMGEMIYGGAKGMKNFVMITLGTGLGSGIVVNGDLVYGHDGFAGEVGHTTVIPHGRVCGCGGEGHLEAYCSAPGIKRTVYELLTKYNGGSELTKYSFDELDSKKVFEAAERGDKVALEAFEITGELLGQGLGDTVCHLSPEAIFLFGGPTAAGDLIFNPTKDSMERHVLPIFRNKVEILPSKLKAGSAAIVGASALVWKELEKE